MRILVTGAGGFVGQHLVRLLQREASDAELHGVTLQTPSESSMTFHTVDLRDGDAVTALLEEVRPDQIYHLAGIAVVRHSFNIPWQTLETNIHAQLNLILACLALDLKPRMLAVTSAEIYSAAVDTPLLDEDAPLQPANPYSVSKAAQDMLAQQYYLSHQLPILRARPFNHIGPGQAEGFVAPDFAMQIARIEAGLQEPIMRVGDLSAERDFTDVRDTVRAYHLIMQHGEPGTAYNIATGVPVSIQTLLDHFVANARVRVEVTTAEHLKRPASKRRACGDASRLRAATGWTPEIPLEQTLLDILNDCRERVAKSKSA